MHNSEPIVGRTLVARQATYRCRRRARPVAIDGRTRCRRQAAGVSRAPCALRARRSDGRRRGDITWRTAAVAAKHVLDPAEPASPLERLAKARERGGEIWQHPPPRGGPPRGEKGRPRRGRAPATPPPAGGVC